MDKKEKIKSLMISIIIFMTFLIAILISYNKVWKERMNSPWAVMKTEDSLNNLGEKQIVELQNGKIISQKIQMVSDNLTGIAIKFVNVNKKAEGNIIIELFDSQDRMVEMWKLDCSILQTDGYCNMYLKEDKKVNVGDRFRIQIKPELQNEKELALELATASTVSGCVKVSNEKSRPLSLSYKLYDGNGKALRYLMIAIVVAAFVMVFGSWLMVLRKEKIAITFVILAFFTGCIYIFALPPFAVPDEGSHIITAYSKSSRLLGKESVDDKGNVVADSNIGLLYFTREEYPTKDSYIRYVKGAAGKSTNFGKSQESLAAPLNKNVVGYFPQVLGMSLARIFRGSGEQILLLGRLFALLWYCFIMYFTIKIFPFNKMIAFAVGLLPMTMQQVCSFSYDSVLMGLSFLLISYILWLVYTKDEVKIGDIIIISGVMLGIVMIKYIYTPIIGLLIFVPKKKFKFTREKKRTIIGMLGVSVSLEIFSKITLITKAAEHDVMIRPDGLYQYSIEYIMKNLGDTIVVVVRTIIENSSVYLESMIGDPLGWFEIKIPGIIIIGFVIILIFSAIPNRESKLFSGKIRIITSGIILLISMLIFAALLISYTYIGADTILGVQGRYFIPILPLALLLVQENKKIIVRKSIEQELILGITGLQLYTIWSILSVVIVR